MQKFYIAQRKLWQIAINFVFVLQIIMFVIIFLLALHWLLNLAGSHLMSWLDPLATSASGFVKLFYKRMITLGGKEIDGSILLFDVILGLLIFALSLIFAI